MADLQSIIARINKEQGDGTLMLGSEWEEQEAEKISSGSLYLDWALGGGFPLGKVVEIYGNESTGKSAVAAKTVAQAQKKGLTCVWVDAENSFDPRWMKKLGIDIEKLIVAQGAEGEVNHDLLLKLVSFGHPRAKQYKDLEPVDVVVVDSWAALTPMVLVENDMQTHMAVEARVNNLGIKRVNSRNKNTLVLIINQNRSGIGARAYDFQPGGRGLKYYAALRVEVRAGEEITQNMIPSYMKIQTNPKDKESPVGHVIKFRVRKNKVGPPRREASVDFYYEGRFDQIKDIATAGKITGVIEQAGAFYKYNDQSFKGIKAFGDFLRANPKDLKEIKEKVLSTV